MASADIGHYSSVRGSVGSGAPQAGSQGRCHSVHQRGWSLGDEQTVGGRDGAVEPPRSHFADHGGFTACQRALPYRCRMMRSSFLEGKPQGQQQIAAQAAQRRQFQLLVEQLRIFAHLHHPGGAQQRQIAG